MRLVGDVQEYFVSGAGGVYRYSNPPVQTPEGRDAWIEWWGTDGTWHQKVGFGAAFRFYEDGDYTKVTEAEAKALMGVG